MKSIITFGEIMGRLTPPGFVRLGQGLPGTLEVTFAGAEANVAASLAFFGGGSSSPSLEEEEPEIPEATSSGSSRATAPSGRHLPQTLSNSPMAGRSAPCHYHCL